MICKSDKRWFLLVTGCKQNPFFFLRHEIILSLLSRDPNLTQPDPTHPRRNFRNSLRFRGQFPSPFPWNRAIIGNERSNGRLSRGCIGTNRREGNKEKGRRKKDRKRRRVVGREGRFLAQALLWGGKGKGTAAIHYGRRMTPREIYRLTASSN